MGSVGRREEAARGCWGSGGCRVQLGFQVWTREKLTGENKAAAGIFCPPVRVQKLRVTTFSQMQHKSKELNFTERSATSHKIK